MKVVRQGGIESPTNGLRVHLSSDEKSKISTSLPLEGGGKKSKSCFKEIIWKALKKKRKKR